MKFSKAEFVESLMEEYEELRADHYASLESRVYLTLPDATKHRKLIDFVANPPAPKPLQLGEHVITKTLEEVVPFIDWNPFFQTWELRGRYPNRGFPKIFNDEKVGAEAKKLYDDALAMMAQIMKDKSLSLKGIVGLYPANTVGYEDVEVYTDDSRTEVATRFCMLRQQLEKDVDNAEYFSQADFVAPKESGVPDYLGMFAVSCFGCDDEAARHAALEDDYSKIMVQALADRFVEAFAESVHRDIRYTISFLIFQLLIPISHLQF
jgi:5-methyltetrahydrofolate--homocysteine methyltransferase